VIRHAPFFVKNYGVNKYNNKIVLSLILIKNRFFESKSFCGLGSLFVVANFQINEVKKIVSI